MKKYHFSLRKKTAYLHNVTLPSYKIKNIVYNFENNKYTKTYNIKNGNTTLNICKITILHFYF